MISVVEGCTRKAGHATEQISKLHPALTDLHTSCGGAAQVHIIYTYIYIHILIYIYIYTYVQVLSGWTHESVGSASIGASVTCAYTYIQIHILMYMYIHKCIYI